MHKPIKLIVAKKTSVPTNQGSKYPTRSDWLKIYKIEYEQSALFFSKVLTDAQLALWLRDTFGLGEYIIYAWMKGRESFWLFSRILCLEETYCRIPKRRTLEDIEMRRLKGDYNRVGRQLKTAESPAEKEEIKEQASEILEEYELNKDIKSLDKDKRVGCYPYLKTLMPIYKEHEYELLGTIHEDKPRREKKEKPEEIKQENYEGSVI